MKQKLGLMKNWLGILAVAQRILLELWRRRVSLVCWIVFSGRGTGWNYTSFLVFDGFCRVDGREQLPISPSNVIRC